MKKAIIWCAVSSQAQTGDDKVSMGQQEKLAHQWCAENGYEVTHVLKVDGYSRRESDLITALEEFRRQGVTAYDELREMWLNNSFDMLVAYTHSRFGRSSTLYTYVVENVIQSGASIFLMDTGMVDSTNYRALTAIGGMMSTTEIDRLVRGRDVAMSARAKKGLPTSSSVIASHKIVRDDLGNARGIELDDTKHRLWQDAATVLLEGVGWKQIESELFERFGHVDENGKPYKSLRMYDWFHNPMFWGHSARQHKGGSKSKNGTKTDMWVFDENVPAPEGVEIYYNVIEPVFKGDQAERVKAELRRRRMSVRGNNRPQRSEPFSGLFICAECGYHLTYNGSKGTPLYACVTRYWENERNYTCTQRRTIPAWKILRWLDRELEALIDAGKPGQLFDPDHSEVEIYNRSIHNIETEINTVDAQLRNLILKQSKIDDDSLATMYDEEIVKLNARRKVLRRNLADVKRDRPNPDIQKGRKLALREITQLSLDMFWDMDGVKINQMLHRLFGEYRLVVKNGEIVGTANPNRVR